MKRALRYILRYYGDTLMVRSSGETVSVRAFFRPLTQKSLQTMQGAFTGLGELPPGYFLYIGPAEVQMQRGDRIRWRDKWFDVRRSEEICIGDEALYRWSLAAPGGEEDPWNC